MRDLVVDALTSKYHRVDAHSLYHIHPEYHGIIVASYHLYNVILLASRSYVVSDSELLQRESLVTCVEANSPRV